MLHRLHYHYSVMNWKNYNVAANNNKIKKSSLAVIMAIMLQIGINLPPDVQAPTRNKALM